MIERTTDYRWIKKHMPPGEVMIISSDVIYLRDGDNMWMIERDNDMPQIHVNMSDRGKAAVNKCKDVIKWVFNNTSIKTLYGVIPKDNRSACHNAVHSGMTFSHETENRRIYEVIYGRR